MDSKNDILSFYDNCRICLEIHNQMTSINSLKERNELASLLIYFNIEVIKDTRYPNRICITCVEELNNTLLFKQKCESSFNYLQEVLKEPVNLNQHDDKKSFCYLRVKDELSLNACDDLESASVKSEEHANSEECERFSCDLCNFVCQTCNCIASHKKLEHEIENDDSESNKKVKTVCEICNKHVLNLKRHKLIHNRSSEDENIYQCQYCEKQFKTSSHCRRHERATHLNERPYKCEHCTKAFTEKETLISHTRIHTGEKPFVCTVCSRGFARKFQLKRHAEIHEDKEPKYFCDDCKIFFTFKQTLYQHKKKYHGDNPPQKIVCKECGQAVNNIYSHMKRKHSVFEFECQYCKKTFPYKSILITHVNNVHENREGSFKSLCTLCGKTFRTNGELNIHNKVNHSEERNYQCNYCERRFKTSSNCRKHERSTHLNDRCFKCHFCPKAFTRKKTLINHIRTHTGEKPFVCNICSRAFSQKTTLATHTKLIHGRALK